MNGHGKSDRLVVPGKFPNKAGSSAAEGMEGRSLAKGNAMQQNTLRTQSREESVPSALDRVVCPQNSTAGLPAPWNKTESALRRLRPDVPVVKTTDAGHADDAGGRGGPGLGWATLE